ncbi:MAG: LysR family transcriptional regulator [Treponema sp.]|nr:LysR family transcriptional regulator [Treponema sp.]
MGVLLFYREKNRISVNENGKFFYPLAKKLLEDAEDAKAKMKAFDESRRLICISSCLPFPLIPLFNEAVKKAFPSRTIQKKLCLSVDLLPSLFDKKSSLIILPHPAEKKGVYEKIFQTEQLFVSLSADSNEFFGKKSLTFEDLKGKTIMLLPLDGYWNELIKEKVKDARFLSQKNAGDYTDIMNSSSLISFSTDLVEKNAPKLKNKKLIPLADKEARLSYTCSCLAEDREFFVDFFDELREEGL